ALRRDLAAASVPAAQQDRIADGLRDCGHDRATAKDPVAVPASCHRLQDDVRAVVAAAPQSAPAVQKAVAEAGEHSAKTGFSDAMKLTLWVEVGLLGLTFLAAFLLPMHPRPEEETA
ncbi:MFS transporter, partial [Actinomadura bangladeshensis]|nr:MFS transporter [Actinomadura bangladeshensis]